MKMQALRSVLAVAALLDAGRIVVDGGKTRLLADKTLQRVECEAPRSPV